MQMGGTLYINGSKLFNGIRIDYVETISYNKSNYYCNIWKWDSTEKFAVGVQMYMELIFILGLKYIFKSTFQLNIENFW